jgi:U2-associated protein SR140
MKPIQLKPAAPGGARKTKNRFQREKEEREAKQRQAEAEAAKVYEDFVASFGAGDDEGGGGGKGGRRGSAGKGGKVGGSVDSWMDAVHQ